MICGSLSPALGKRDKKREYVSLSLKRNVTGREREGRTDGRKKTQMLTREARGVTQYGRDTVTSVFG